MTGDESIAREDRPLTVNGVPRVIDQAMNPLGVRAYRIPPDTA
jgi:hypothetical protein